jgi:hypothetical protein
MVRRDGEYGWSVFGEMEQHSLRRDISHHGQKSGKHVCEKRLSSKTDIKRITHRKLPIFTLFYLFLSLFIFRSIMVAT